MNLLILTPTVSTPLSYQGWLFGFISPVISDHLAMAKCAGEGSQAEPGLSWERSRRQLAVGLLGAHIPHVPVPSAGR